MASRETEIFPELDEQTLDRDLESTHIGNPYIVILYNDDYHGLDEVVSQLQLATGYEIIRCVQIMMDAHTRGRAVAYSGTEKECERAANILRQIRLQVETDKS